MSGDTIREALDTLREAAEGWPTPNRYTEALDALVGEAAAKDEQIEDLKGQVEMLAHRASWVHPEDAAAKERELRKQADSMFADAREQAREAADLRAVLEHLAVYPDRNVAKIARSALEKAAGVSPAQPAEEQR